MGKRKNRQEDPATLTKEERERRRRQKELRDVALKLRSQGQTYNPNKYRRILREGKSVHSGLGSVKDDHKPRRPPQIVVVPIFWNRREEEKEVVLAVAERAQTVLRGIGLRCDTDTSHKLTPGQKFRHWEERGVMVRVEIGPQEAEADACMLAICKIAGEVAHKRRIRVGADLATAAAEALHIDIDPEKLQHNALEGGEKEEAGKEDAAPRQQQPTQVEENERSEKTRKKNKKTTTAGEKGSSDAPSMVDQEKKETESNQAAILRSGDDLDGDFAGDVLLGGPADVDAEPGTKKKGKKKGKKGGAAGEEVDWAFGDGGEGNGDWKQTRNKKDRVVKFM